MKQAAPVVSVVIPSFNHAQFIGDAIRSILDQSLRDLELIVVDDASSDGSPALLRSLPADPRLHIVCLQTNVGAPAAMNTGAARARGEFIAFCGSDDQFMQEKLARQVDLLRGRPELSAVFTHIELIDEHGIPWEPSSHPWQATFAQHNRSREAWLQRFFHEGNCLCQPSALIRRSTFERVGRQDARLAQLHDFALWLDLLQHGDIAIIEQPLTRYRRRRVGGSLSDGSIESFLRVRWEWLQVLPRFLKVDPSLGAGVFGGKYTEARQRGATHSQAVALAAAINPNRWYQQFALQTLFDTLPAAADADMAPGDHWLTGELRKLSGELDILGIRAEMNAALAIRRALQGQRPQSR